MQCAYPIVWEEIGAIHHQTIQGLENALMTIDYKSAIIIVKIPMKDFVNSKERKDELAMLAVYHLAGIGFAATTPQKTWKTAEPITFS